MQERYASGGPVPQLIHDGTINASKIMVGTVGLEKLMVNEKTTSWDTLAGNHSFAVEPDKVVWTIGAAGKNPEKITVRQIHEDSTGLHSIVVNLGEPGFDPIYGRSTNGDSTFILPEAGNWVESVDYKWGQLIIEFGRPFTVIDTHVTIN